MAQCGFIGTKSGKPCRRLVGSHNDWQCGIENHPRSDPSEGDLGGTDAAVMDAVGRPDAQPITADPARDAEDGRLLQSTWAEMLQRRCAELKNILDKAADDPLTKPSAELAHDLAVRAKAAVGAGEGLGRAALAKSVFAELQTMHNMIRSDYSLSDSPVRQHVGKYLQDTMKAIGSALCDSWAAQPLSSEESEQVQLADLALKYVLDRIRKELSPDDEVQIIHEVDCWQHLPMFTNGNERSTISRTAHVFFEGRVNLYGNNLVDVSDYYDDDPEFFGHDQVAELFRKALASYGLSGEESEAIEDTKITYDIRAERKGYICGTITIPVGESVDVDHSVHYQHQRRNLHAETYRPLRIL